MKKQRIDDYLVERDYLASHDEAMRYIMAGKVLNGAERIHSPAEKIDPQKADVRIKGKKKYVSRGGLKLEKALDVFHIDLNGAVHLDIGSSTGGFTDCALQHGAKMSYALDVGTNQLAYELRTNPRVVVMEQTNFRHVTADMFNPKPNSVSIDVSFISLKNIFPKLAEVVAADVKVIALVKPQFEAARDAVGEKGIVRSESVHQTVIKNVLKYALDAGFSPRDLEVSPIKGAAGNIEYLLHLDTGSTEEISDEAIASLVKSAQAAQ